MDVDGWLVSACADADRRGLPELKPLLETLARSLRTLRDADEDFAHPALARGTLTVSAPGDAHPPDERLPNGTE